MNDIKEVLNFITKSIPKIMSNNFIHNNPQYTIRSRDFEYYFGNDEFCASLKNKSYDYWQPYNETFFTIKKYNIEHKILTIVSSWSTECTITNKRIFFNSKVDNVLYPEENDTSDIFNFNLENIHKLSSEEMTVAEHFLINKIPQEYYIKIDIKKLNLIYDSLVHVL